MDAATATQPTVSLVKDVAPSHCYGDGSPARPWVLHKAHDGWWRDQH